MEERGTRTDMPMKPQVVTYELNKLLDGDAIVSSDSGTIATWAARYIEMRGDMQFSLSGTLATMANGLPYSIGAAVAYPGRQVVCVVGDGGFTMLMGEIATLVKYSLTVKVIVIKNNVLGMIKWEQMVFEGNPQYGVRAAADRLRLRRTGLRRRRLHHRGSCPRPSRVGRSLRIMPDRRSSRPLSIPTSRRCPGKITTEQAWQFAKALVKGQKKMGHHQNGRREQDQRSGVGRRAYRVSR